MDAPPRGPKLFRMKKKETPMAIGWVWGAGGAIQALWGKAKQSKAALLGLEDINVLLVSF